MERFKEDRTTLLYFYQQVRGGPGGLLAPARSALQLTHPPSSRRAFPPLRPRKSDSQEAQDLAAHLPSPWAADGQPLWSHPHPISIRDSQSQPLHPTPAPAASQRGMREGVDPAGIPCQHPLCLLTPASPRQLRSEYMQNYASKVSEGMALQLGCLELRYVPPPVRARLLQREGWGGRGERDLGPWRVLQERREFPALFFAVVGGRGGGHVSAGRLSDVPPFSQEVL